MVAYRLDPSTPPWYRGILPFRGVHIAMWTMFTLILWQMLNISKVLLQQFLLLALWFLHVFEESLLAGTKSSVAKIFLQDLDLKFRFQYLLTRFSESGFFFSPLRICISWSLQCSLMSKAVFWTLCKKISPPSLASHLPNFSVPPVTLKTAETKTHRRINLFYYYKIAVQNF